HIAIDDKEAIQLIPFNRNVWHAGDGSNGDGNRNYIAIEICYSKSGGDRFIKAEQRAAKEVASLLKQYGWGISKIRKHQDFSGKYCPHRTLDMGWQRFLNMAQAELGG
ncbi:N-acetylmuramoyl-L-alanine amidase family protein, partial [Clostridium perfringens]|uniref:peptidoglycan recognition protein family protein n=2 Tax=Clostridium TaxID=1485 RepID=UPI002ACBE53C